MNQTTCLKIMTAVLAGLLISTASPAADLPGQWSAAKANEWYAAQPWLVGCNFLPSTAVNDVEMWQAESFDVATIERELGWAHDLGFNTVRVFLNYVVWEADAEGLKQRFEKFLAIADKLGIRTMPILFDDCFLPEPVVGKQKEPVPGVHNSQWVRGPGIRRMVDKTCWPLLEKYAKDMVGTFGQDRRIVMWDPYNEPSASRPLAEAVFRWVREAKPSQPLSSVWIGEPYSDIISLHNYLALPGLQEKVAAAKKYGRPVIVTEWMARTNGSTFEKQLPYFKNEKIGCWNWGLVAGRTQTYFPSQNKTAIPGATDPPLWFHDILRKDGTPYKAREAAVIRYYTGASKLPPPEPAVIVPTAEKEAVLWRCSMETPAADWFKPGFDDSAWKSAPAPFGRADPKIDRQPRSQWSSHDLWLRREFEMPAGEFADLALRTHHDEDTEIYVDGVLAAKLTGFNTAYECETLSPESVALLKPGKHIMAVHCRQTVGGQYIDVGIAGIAVSRNSESQMRRPNILLILADDLGWSDVGCYGSEIKTPNLDALAADGLRFTRFYNSARCSPTRASILTGLEPHAAGFANLGGKFAPGSVLISEALAAAGYHTCMVGKWHLGENQSNPVNRGFKEFYGFLGGFNTCWREHPAYALWPKDRTPREYAPGKFYSTDVFRDYALDFIEQGRKVGKPWFLYLAFNAAHFPLHAPEEEIAKYEAYYQRGWDKVREERFERQKKLGVLPANAELSPRSRIPKNKFNAKTEWADKDNPAWDSLPAARRHDLARRMAVYAGMIDRMDQAIGRIVADLRQHGELDNTLIVFLSDNGACAEWNPLGFDGFGGSGANNILHAGEDLKKIGAPDSFVSYGSGWANACNTPWRLYKHYCHEGGIRTPFIVHWPAGLKTVPGSLTAQPGHITDLMPTFLELAEANYPKELNGNSSKLLTGTSLVPTFTGQDLPDRLLCFEHEGNRAAMQGKWKLVAINGKPWELYDTESDPVELKNVAKTRTEVVKRLTAEWEKWAVANNCSSAQPKAGPFHLPQTSGDEGQDAGTD